MSNIFSGLHESLQQVLAQRMGWTEIRDVQEQAYSAIASGKDVLIIAPTAGGKSEAALIPVVDDILKHGRQGVSCLYISPLKALINDQEDRFRVFCIPTSLLVMKWHGDVAKGDRTWSEGEPPHFLMITPESLEVVLLERDLSRDLRQVRTIIVDELHSFVESERGVQLKVLLDRMDRLAKRKIQRIGLSATTGNPDEVLAWLSDNRHGSELVAVPAPPKEKQFQFNIEAEEQNRIDALVRIVQGKKALVFVNSRSEAEKITSACSGRIRNIHIHHSSLATATRKAAEDAFSYSDSVCIICTSTLELGIDIGDLDVVVQVGPPDSVSSFLQRMGRSGRRSRNAFVAWVLRNPCELLCSVAIIECAIRKEVEALVPLKKPYNVLLQQIFLYLHTHPGATRRQLVPALRMHPVFSGMDPAIFGQIIAHLIATGYVVADGEILMMGPEAERVFGRSNWKDLYSIISSGEEYRAVTPDGEVVGRLDARFVNSSNNGEISLGGQGWSMVKCDEGHNIVVVVPSDSAKSRIFWTGGEDIGFSPLVCGTIRKILARGGSLLPLGDPEREMIATVLRRIPEGAGNEGLNVSARKGTRGIEVSVYSFAGSRFNRLLALFLGRCLASKAPIRYNDIVVRVPRPVKEGQERAVQQVISALDAIGRMEREEIGASIPVPRTESWKFACALPESLIREMVLFDHYRMEEFRDKLTGMPVSAVDNQMPDVHPECQE